MYVLERVLDRELPRIRIWLFNIDKYIMTLFVYVHNYVIHA